MGFATYSSIGGQAPCAVARHGVGGHGDDGLVVENAVFRGADDRRRFQAIHDGHLHIHQNDVEILLCQDHQRLFAVIRHDDGMAPTREHSHPNLLVCQAVFDQQDPQRRQFADPGCLHIQPAALVWTVEPQRPHDDIVQFGLLNRFQQLRCDTQIFSVS